MQVVDVRHGEPQRVQLAELRVRGHPGQRQLESLERFTEDSHPRPLASIGS